jgi:UDP-glucose 4-epimerase
VDWHNRKVVVIGGAGFVGSHLTDLLRTFPVKEIIVLDNFLRGTKNNLREAATDERVKVVEGSVTDTGILRRLFQNADYVFHLAALWLHECLRHPRRAIDVNVVGTFNVIEAALEAGVKKVIYSSSASVYGNALVTPMTEEHPFNNRTLYGGTKIAGEQFFRSYYDQYKLNYVGLRYMNVYGPRMDYQGAYVSIIPKALDRIDRAEPPVITGDGNQSYDFVYVSDVAKANLLAAESDATDECFNVCSGTRTSIKEVVDKLLEITGSKLEPQYEPAGQTFVTQRLGSPDKAASQLGFKATVPLDEGLRSIVHWRTQAVEQQTVIASANHANP